MSQNVDVFIGGRVIRNTSDIGFYTTSWKLAFIAAGIFTTLASSMVFPTLTRLQGDLTALRTKLLTSIRQVGLAMFPASWLLAALAPVIIVPLLGEKWAPYRSSFLVLSMLAVYAGNRTMLSIFFEGYKSIGKPWIVPVYNTIKLAIMVPAMIFGAQHGIIGLALTYIPVQILEFPAALILARNVLGVSPLQVWRAARTPILGTLLMVVGVIATERILTSLRLGDLITLACCLPVAGAIYLGALFLMDRRILLEARGVLLKGF
jgi:PST family polysaccharide transporter